MSIISEEMRLIDENNIYGGRTFESLLDYNEQVGSGISRIVRYFDSEDNAIIIEATVTNEFTARTGMIKQINHIRNDMVERYEKHFSEQFEAQHDFNKMIEETNHTGEIIRKAWYHNDILLDYSRSIDDRFEFNNLQYLEEEYFLGYEPNERGDVIILSAKYFRIRLVIRFGTELINLSDSDFRNMRSLSASFGFQSMEHLYRKKVRIFSGNSSYWFYVQTELEPFVLGQKATIRYYPIGLNKEMYLIGIGFYDI